MDSARRRWQSECLPTPPLAYEIANVPERVSNAHYFVTVKVDASTMKIVNDNTHHVHATRLAGDVF